MYMWCVCVYLHTWEKILTLTNIQDPDMHISHHLSSE